jgi:hypothetical protein
LGVPGTTPARPPRCQMLVKEQAQTTA